MLGIIIPAYALMLGSLSYLVPFLAEVLFPNCTTPDIVAVPSVIGEIGIALWLTVVGIREPANTARPASLSQEHPGGAPYERQHRWAAISALCLRLKDPDKYMPAPGPIKRAMLKLSHKLGPGEIARGPRGLPSVLSNWKL
jgi:hypothetical protein